MISPLSVAHDVNRIDIQIDSVARFENTETAVLFNNLQNLTGSTNCILDKQAVIKRNSKLIGPEAYPIVIAKNVVI